MLGPLCHVRIPLSFFAAALIGACGGDPVDSSSTGGSGGSGGSGGTTVSTSSGGSGGGGTGGGTGGGAGCSPECVAPKVCEEGSCKTVVELQFTAQDTGLLEGGVVTQHRGLAEVCAREHAKLSPDEIIAEEGGCVVYGKLGEEEWLSVPLDAGDLSVESPNVGLLPLTANGQSGCLAHFLADGMDLADGEGFAPGETVTFKATGGAMFPAETLETPFPEDFVIEGDPTYVSGQPYHVQWTGATPTKVFLLAPVGDGTIECTPSGGTSLTIPAAVTEHLIDINQTIVMGYLESTGAIEISPSRRVTTTTMRLRAYLAD